MPSSNSTTISAENQSSIAAPTTYPVATKISYVFGQIHPMGCPMVSPRSPSPMELSPRRKSQFPSSSSHHHSPTACPTKNASTSTTLYSELLGAKPLTISEFLDLGEKHRSHRDPDLSHRLSPVANGLTKTYAEDLDLTPSRTGRTRRKPRRRRS